MTADQPEGIDVRNNPESRAAAENAPSSVARASAGGMPPRDAPAAGEAPEPASSGTAAGNPVAGVTINPDDRDDAVSGDTGPDELGQRGPAVGS